jgi:hypothetical protein
MGTSLDPRHLRHTARRPQWTKEETVGRAFELPRSALAPARRGLLAVVLEVAVAPAWERYERAKGMR